MDGLFKMYLKSVSWWTGFRSFNSFNMRPNDPMRLHIFIALLSSHIFLGICQYVDKDPDRWNHGYNDVDHRGWEGDINNATAYGASLSTEGFSTAEDCARACQDGEAPRWCYYKFTVEFYATMSRACELCTPDYLNQLSNTPQCQCIQADGLEHGLLTINRMLPGPSIQVCKNDRIIVDVENDVDGMGVAIHWHGIWQKGSQYYDGTPGLTQCPINPGSTFRYQFIADNPGSHFYHSHVMTGLADGQYGSLIIREPLSINPYYSAYDEDRPDHVIVISDIFHKLSTETIPRKCVRNRGRLPDSLLINGKGRWKDPTTTFPTTSQLESFTVEAGKRYRIRLINSMGSVCPIQFAIEGHSCTLIAQDGEFVQPIPVDTVNTHTGDRIDCIITANMSVRAYWIRVQGIGACSRPDLIQLAVLKYRGGPDLPETPEPDYQTGLQLGIVYNPLDAICDVDRTSAVCANQLKAVDKVSMELLKVQPDYRIILPFRSYSFNATNNIPTLFRPGTYPKFMVDENGDHIVAEIDNISHRFSSGPALSQPENAADTCNRNHLPENCSTPCACPHTHHIKLGALLEVVIYDENPDPIWWHPFHLHGYTTRMLKIGRFADTQNSTKRDISGIMNEHQKMLESGSYQQPPGKDTVVVPPGGYAIARFIADNPGWWLFDWHSVFRASIGMNVVFHVGEQSDLPPVPPMFPTCGNFQPGPRMN